MPSNSVNLIKAAMDVGGEGITIADISTKEGFLIYVNQGFSKLTGYSADECIGKNCRFLQGKNTNQESLNTIRSSIRGRTGCKVELLNYKKDRTPFWNRLTLEPFMENGQYYMIGIQMDITREKMSVEHLSLLTKQLMGFSVEFEDFGLIEKLR